MQRVTIQVAVTKWPELIVCLRKDLKTTSIPTKGKAFERLVYACVIKGLSGHREVGNLVKQLKTEQEYKKCTKNPHFKKVEKRVRKLLPLILKAKRKSR